jgi:hypothetical protein
VFFHCGCNLQEIKLADENYFVVERLRKTVHVSGTAVPDWLHHGQEACCGFSRI